MYVIWLVPCLLVLIVSELLYVSWNVFFKWYRQKREREAVEFLSVDVLNQLQSLPSTNLPPTTPRSQKVDKPNNDLIL